MKLFVTLARTIPSAVCALVLAASGCSNDAPAPAAQGTAETKGAGAHEHTHGGGHDHGSTGPHDGQIVELGNEDYHAELVHDEKAGTVTIYLLDGAAKNAVAIETPELTINVKQSGKGRQFMLAASPQEGDAAGKSSRFSSDDKELNEALDEEGATARLVVEVDGKSYTGRLEHHHDHEGHDHKHCSCNHRRGTLAAIIARRFRFPIPVLKMSREPRYPDRSALTATRELHPP